MRASALDMLDHCDQAYKNLPKSQKYKGDHKIFQNINKKGLKQH